MLQSEALQILDRKIAVCRKCEGLAEYRDAESYTTVPGVGLPNADLMVIGEAPGKNEAKQGEPFVGKAGNLLTNILKAAGWQRDQIFITNILKCLYGPTAILTADGYKRVDWIVKHGYQGKVACVDSDNQIQWRIITGWHKSPRLNRRLHKVSLDYARKNHRGKTGGIFTEDHEFLTRAGWKQLINLQPMDSIHSGTTQPSQQVRQMLVGMMLGDAQFRGNNFCCGHSYKQFPYLLHKAKLLGHPITKMKFTPIEIQGTNTAAVGFCLKATPFYRKMQDFFYQNGIKRITPGSLRDFGAISLAYLFMDDGHLRPKKISEIATCNFEEEDVKLLIRVIEKRFSICGYLRQNSQYPRIHFGVENTTKLSEIIAPFVPESMEYKLLPEHRTIPKVVLDLTPEPFFDEFEIVRRTDCEVKSKSVYCISVEEFENFITRSGVVHNCRPPGNRDPEEAEANNCRQFLDMQIRCINPKWILCFGRIASVFLLGKDSDTTIGSLRGEVHDFDGRKVICTYHPSYLLRQPAAKKDVWEDIQPAIFALQPNSDDV